MLLEQTHRSNFQTGEDSGHGLLPALVEAFRESGFEEGRRRGVNDVLGAYLEAAESYLRGRSDAHQARRELHEFAVCLEQFVLREASQRGEGFGFEEGGGI